MAGLSGIGIDIEETNRFKLKKNDTFLKNTFTPQELKYAFACTQPEIRLAGFFCAKEASKKATGKHYHMNELEVRHEKSGKPIMFINGKKAKLEISISHTVNTAVAVSIIVSK